jgi:hypothetical protein
LSFLNTYVNAWVNFELLLRRGQTVFVGISGTAAANGPIFSPSGDIYEWTWNGSGMTSTGKTEELAEEPVPVPSCPPQTPHELLWGQTWAFAESSGLLIS